MRSYLLAQISIALICCLNYSPATASQIAEDVDSVLIGTFDDPHGMPDFPDGKTITPTPFVGVKLKNSDVEILNQYLYQKDSYGQSQAITPIYDMKIKYYKNDSLIHEISISLYTNNLFATFPLYVQRQGNCLCEGDGGYCCSKGGISLSFKKYLIGLMEKYQLLVEKDDILELGK